MVSSHKIPKSLTSKHSLRRVKDRPPSERPREKLQLRGAQELSNSELLALLLRSGTASSSAVQLADQVLDTTAHKLEKLSRATVADLCQISGVGMAKAAAVVAAFELGRRARFPSEEKPLRINSSAVAYHCMEPLLGHLDHEEFWVLFLNNAHGVLSRCKISSGGYTGTLVDVRIILKKALLAKAVGIILVHNHPSGTLKPSQADVALTQKIVKAAKSIDITVLDHLIVTEKAYFSFADKHLL